MPSLVGLTIDEQEVVLARVGRYTYHFRDHVLHHEKELPLELDPELFVQTGLVIHDSTVISNRDPEPWES